VNLYGVRRALNAAASIAKQASLSEAADKGRGALRAGSGCSDMGIGSKIKHTANDVKDMVPGLGKIRAPDHLDDGEHDPENNKYVGEAGGSAADKGVCNLVFTALAGRCFVPAVVMSLLISRRWMLQDDYTKSSNMTVLLVRGALQAITLSMTLPSTKRDGDAKLARRPLARVGKHVLCQRAPAGLAQCTIASNTWLNVQTGESIPTAEKITSAAADMVR
jgi:hypothetical protein